jgi:hypothetical protein
VVFSRVEYTFEEVAAALLLTGGAIKCVQVDGAEVALPGPTVVGFDVFGAAGAPAAITGRLSGKHRVTVIAAAATAPVLTLQHKATPIAVASSIGAAQLCSA